jgi:hypothetical protein
MAGYRRERKSYKLRFVDDEMAGLVVEARSTNLGAFLDVAEWVDLDPATAGPEELRKLAALFETFAASLDSWNLEDDHGQPVPATLAGLRAQDVDFALAIIRAWFEAIGGVPGPLGASSSDGGRSLEGSIPMATRSASQAS